MQLKPGECFSLPQILDCTEILTIDKHSSFFVSDKYAIKVRVFVNSETYYPSPIFVVEYMSLSIGNGGIHLGINYSVSNEMKRDEQWPNTEDFRLLNYSFNTGNIRSIIGEIVTEFYQIFQQLNKYFIVFIAQFSKSWTYWVTIRHCIFK